MDLQSEMMRARQRPRRERRDFAAAMRAAGLERCCRCGDWSSDTGEHGGEMLCGLCADPLYIGAPDPDHFQRGTLEHQMASRLAAKENV